MGTKGNVVFIFEYRPRNRLSNVRSIWLMMPKLKVFISLAFIVKKLLEL